MNNVNQSAKGQTKFALILQIIQAFRASLSSLYIRSYSLHQTARQDKRVIRQFSSVVFHTYFNIYKHYYIFL